VFGIGLFDAHDNPNMLHFILGGKQNGRVPDVMAVSAQPGGASKDHTRVPQGSAKLGAVATSSAAAGTGSLCGVDTRKHRTSTAPHRPSAPSTRSTKSKFTSDTTEVASGKTDSTGYSSDGERPPQQVKIIRGEHTVIEHMPHTVFRTKKEVDIATSSRLLVFRTHAEEKDIHFRTYILIDGALDALVDAILEENLDHFVPILAPQYERLLRKSEASKMEKLSERLVIAVVADPADLLQNRDVSFVDERGGSGDSSCVGKVSEGGHSGKENRHSFSGSRSDPAGTWQLLPAPQCNGEAVLQRVLTQQHREGAGRVNPLFSGRGGRRSVCDSSTTSATAAADQGTTER
jgi:hypothetical protein